MYSLRWCIGIFSFCCLEFFVDFFVKYIKIGCMIGNNVLISFSDRQMYLSDVLFEAKLSEVHYGKWI